MEVELWGIDAFASQPFTGNPAVVMFLTRPADPLWMQKVASQMNVAETAFVVPRADGYGIRWFSPKVEVDLCGHATLASAHGLWESRRVPPTEPIHFHTRVSGILSCSVTASGIEMEFPGRPAVACDLPQELAGGLGLEPKWVGRTEYDYLCELEDEMAVRNLRPDLRLLGQLPVRGIIVTALGQLPYDFVSRFFAPAVGVDEDPVTGSAHASLASFWGERLGRSELLAWQASARGGEVGLRWNSDRVTLRGRATTVWRGCWAAGS